MDESQYTRADESASDIFVNWRASDNKFDALMNIVESRGVIGKLSWYEWNQLIEPGCKLHRMEKCQMEMLLSRYHNLGYVGRASHDRAIGYLTDKPIGTYLVRRSMTHDDLLHVVAKVPSTELEMRMFCIGQYRITSDRAIVPAGDGCIISKRLKLLTTIEERCKGRCITEDAEYPYVVELPDSGYNARYFSFEKLLLEAEDHLPYMNHTPHTHVRDVPCNSVHYSPYRFRKMSRLDELAAGLIRPLQLDKTQLSPLVRNMFCL